MNNEAPKIGAIMPADRACRLAKSNFVIFAEAAMLMRRYSAPAHIAPRFDRLAELAKTAPAQSARVLRALLEGLKTEGDL